MKVFIERCNRCPFGSSPLLNGDKLEKMLCEIREADAAFFCHRNHGRGTDIICRGYFDSNLNETARRLKRYEFCEFIEQPPFHAGADQWDTDQYPVNVVHWEITKSEFQN